MRRFDKLKVIKEANQILEEKFLANKLVILEQNEEPTNDEEPTNIEDFNLVKKELGISGDNVEASGTIRNGNGKQITINSKGEYTIFDDNENELQKGEYKIMGIWPNKHTEFKPSKEKNYFKLKNILSNLDKKVSSEPTSFSNTFSKLVKNSNNLSTEDGGAYYSYPFYTNKNGVTILVHLYPEPDGVNGEFKMSWIKNNPSDDEESKGQPKLWVGSFKNNGTIFKSKDAVVSIDKKGKIDSGLITILSKFWPKYKD